MKELDEHLLKKFAKSILFENNIVEIFQPDDDTTPGLNMRYIHDRPGPQINGDGDDMSAAIDIELPVGSCDIVNNPTTINKVSPAYLYDKQYCPDNATELSISITSLLDDERSSEVNREVIQKIWNSLTTILQGVK